MARPAQGLEGLDRVLGNRSRPDVAWVAGVAGVSAAKAELAVEGVARFGPQMKSLADTIEGTGRAYYAQFPAPIDLYALVRLTRPKVLVESGVASGVSTAFMLLGVRANRMGALHSIDYPVERVKGKGNESWAIPSGMSSGWAIPEGLKRKWDLRLGRSEDLLRPLLTELGAVDFYCHDSPVDAKHFGFEMGAIRRHLAQGSVVVADNSVIGTIRSLAEAMGTDLVQRKGSSLTGFRVPVRG
jgi:Methyltransferase domain